MQTTMASDQVAMTKSSLSILKYLLAIVPRKPKSSLSFLQYPTLRDHPLHTPEIWLEGKRADDGAEDLWRIHDNLYDFTSFVATHPGGKDWLKLTKGTDITEAFECHHISKIPEQLLHNYFIRKATGPRNSPFSFDDDGFYRTLKGRVREIVKDLPESRATKSKIFADSLFLSYIILACLSAYFNSFTIGILAGIALSMNAIAAHNFFHQRDNFRMFYFDFAFLSSRSWRVSHALSHHLYTNTIYDIEIQFTEPWFQLLPVKKHFIWKYASWAYSPIAYLLAIPVFYLHMLLQAILDRGRSFQVTWILPFTILAPMYLVSPERLENVLLLFVVITLSLSVHFTVVGINAAHHHPDIFHDGDEPRFARKRSNLDWGLHEIDAVADREDINWSHFLVLTSFGDHCLHHLFPTLDHGKLRYLYPIFNETCKEFNVEMRMTHQMNLVAGQFRQLARETPRKFKERVQGCD